MTFRLDLRLLTGCLILTLSQAIGAQSGEKIVYDIPAQSLESALTQFAVQSKRQLAFDPETVPSHTAPSLVGAYTALEALSLLISNSGLSYSVDSKNTIIVRRSPIAATGSKLRLAQVNNQLNGDSNSDQAAAVSRQQPIEEVIVVESSKMGTSVARTPQSISMLSAVDMQMRGALSISDALRYVPGTVANFNGFDGRAMYDWVLLRGFNASSSGNYRDGLRQSSGWFAAPVTETYNIERLEILRGPSSSLFGQSDAGGIINRISKRPDPNAPTELVAEFGTYERKKLSADFGAALTKDETLRYRVVTTGLDTETQLQYPNGERSTSRAFFIAPSLLWKPSENTSLLLLTDYRTNRLTGDSYSPPALDGSYSGVMVGDPDYGRYQLRQGSAGYRLEHGFNDTWVLRQNFRFFHASAEVDDIYDGGFQADGHTMNRSAIRSDDWFDQTLLDTQLQGTFSGDTIDQTLLFGVDASSLHSNVHYYTGAAPSIDYLNPIYGQPVEIATSLLLDRTGKSQLAGLYVQHQARFDERWIVTLGSRYDWARVTTDNNRTSTSTRQRDEAFSARAGVSYVMANGLTPYLSYAQSFLPQSGVDFAGTPFEPTRGTQYEVGVKYQPAGFRGLLTAALFDISKTNVTTGDPEHYGYRYTKGELRSRGVELEGRIELLSHLDLAASYTYLDVEVAKSTLGDEGKVPVDIPSNMASLWLNYSGFSQALDGLNVGGGVRYVDRRFDNALNTQSSAGYTLVDATVQYGHGAWQYALNAVNLFDKHYIQSRNGGYYYLGYDRTFNLAIKYRW
ncbi:TonB-dependent siderophore receptor [Steroidobacter sp.]|uniref:TonB-dependent siderophore receptor n=1 Tax=Steroidobacter sp. TaxID=1978227 RepID=UPI001A4C784A|nr:TonB-dependent siderophore receptor [Steroidobacter sp.]MBL8268827.1 TonB-dependent siderophore receptor [Steroidobacter sp.]